MTDFEERQDRTPNENAASASPNQSWDISPEYVQDLLSRLQETMAVIEDEEQETEATEPETVWPVIREDDLPPWEVPADEVPAEEAPAEEAPAEEAPAEEAPAGEAPAEEAPAEEAPAEEAPAEEAPAEEAPAGEAPAEEALVEEAPAEEALVEEAPAEEASEPKIEEIGLYDIIDALIAENREKKRAETSCSVPPVSRASAITDELLSLGAEDTKKAETVLGEPVPVTKESESGAQPPSEGIWEMASEASAVAAAEREAERAAHRRRFHARFLFKAVSMQDVGEGSPLFDREEASSDLEEGIGALHPQDFFIADLRREEELTAQTVEEYVSRNQIETVLARYAEEKRRKGGRLVIAVLLSLVLLVFENLPLLGVSVCDVFGFAPRVYTLLDLALLASCLLLAADILREGVGELFAWELGTSGIALVSSLATVLLSTVALIGGTAEEAPPCALPAALAVTLALGFSRLHTRDAEKTFTYLCESGDKLAAEILPAAYATEESAALGRRVKSVLRVKKVGFVTGYFARMKKKREDYRLHTALTLASLAALLVGTLLYFLISPAKTLASVLSFAAWLSLPLSASVYFAARRLTFHHLVETADSHGSAVLGEAAAEEYAAVDSVAFEDVEAFPSRNVRVKRIKMYDNSRLDELLYYMASIFSVLGGPLDGVFRVSASELGLSEDITLVSTAPEGLEATVDGTPVSIGRWGYFPTERVEPYYDTEDVYKEDAGNISILYVAVGGRIAAKLYIEYTVSRRFEKTVRRLEKNGVAPLVRSFDPGITDALLSTAVHFPGLHIKAVRKKVDQVYDFAEARVDAGLVTGAGSRDLLYTFFLCQNYRKATRLLALMKVLSVPLTLLAAILLALTSGLGTFYSVYGAALSLGWLLPVYFISRFYFKKER